MERLGKLEGSEGRVTGAELVGKAKKAVPDSDPPASLDYERWFGPARSGSSTPTACIYLFRFFWDYSGGQQTNFGAHDLDIAQWAVGMDDSGPTTIEGTATLQ